MKEEKQRIAIWDITSKCNLKCHHCYNQERYWEDASRYPELSRRDIETIIDKLTLLNFTRLHLLGGEPLMAKNLQYIVTYAKKNNLDVTMVTNGTLLTKKLYIDLFNWGVQAINISIDGTTSIENDAIRGEGSFDTVKKNLEDIFCYRKNVSYDMCPIQLSFTLTKCNLNQPIGLVSFAHSLGMQGVTLSYLSNEGKARDNYKNLQVSQEEKFQFIDKTIDDFKKFDDIALYIDARCYLSEYVYKKHGVCIEADVEGCKGGDGQFYILADGTLLPCSPAGTSMGQCLKNILPENESYPNLIRDTIETIISSKSLICFYNYTRDNTTYKETSPCNECHYSCHACPLLYNKQHIVEECLFARKKILQLDQEMLQTRFTKSKNVRFCMVGNVCEILDFKSQDKLLLEGIGLEIWNLLDGKITLEDICKLIFDKFSETVSYKEIQKDILEYIYSLKEKNLII